MAELSIADRATIANMCPEYGATVGFFPVDDMSLKYLQQTGEGGEGGGGGPYWDGCDRHPPLSND